MAAVKRWFHSVLIKIDHPVLKNDPLKYERWAEFLGEGGWWFDVCRWKLGAVEAAYYVKVRSGSIKWDDKRSYAQPIPVKEFETNPNMIQNPEYTNYSLRIAGYGNNLSLFKTDQTGKYYYLNPQISKRYFTQELNATKGNMDFFRKDKIPGTLRIFVSGSSTAIGFPYMYNGAFPRMLNYRLQRHFPELNIEMINLSLTAINSYAVLDMAKELAKYQPDAVLIYAGQNEYHGTLGVASSSRFGNHPFLINLFIRSKQSRLMQFIYNTIYASKKTDASTDLNLTLMERLAAGQQIPLGSVKYKFGLQQFERNMGQVLDLFSSEKIPVFIGTLVTNERGIHPFVSNLSNPGIATEWNQLFEKGKLSLENGDTLQAFDSFTAANKLDSTFAECHFRLG